jgi:hypothetical protein
MLYLWYIILIKTYEILHYWYHNICMLIVTCFFLLYVLKKFWCQRPEEGDIITPKHTEAMQTISIHRL